MSKSRIFELRAQANELTRSQRLQWSVAWGSVSIYPARDWPAALCQAALDAPDGHDGYERPIGEEDEPQGQPDNGNGHHNRISGNGADDLADAIRRIAAGAVPAQALDEAKVLELAGSIDVGEPRIHQIATDVATRSTAALEAKIDALETAIANRPVTTVEIKRHNTAETVVIDRAHACLAKIVRRASLRANILVVGPGGSGKTTLAAQVATALGFRHASIDLNGATSEAVLVGRNHPINGRFISTVFIDYYENGGVLLLDELDGADPSVLICLHRALSNGSMGVSDPANPTRHRHADFICIAAANTWGHGADRVYVGRNQLDGASLDRFRSAQFNVDYDENLEREIGHPDVVAFAHATRRKVRELKLRRIVSTRWISDASKQHNGGIDLDELKESFFADWPQDERAKVEA